MTIAKATPFKQPTKYVNETSEELQAISDKESAWTSDANTRYTAIYNDVLNRHIDNVAKQKKYPDGNCCATYVSSGNTTWASEAQTFIDWRDDARAYLLDVLSDIRLGNITAPTIASFLSNAPAITW